MLLSNISFSQSVPSYVPTSGLVGWWGFNGNAQDGSGNGNHGTVNGATLTTDRFGNQNGAYSFLNPTDLISVNPTQVNIEGYTFTCWFKKTSNSQGGTFFVGSNFQTNTYGLLMGVDNNSEIGFGAENGLNSVFTYSNFADYFDNNWHFICAVYSCSSGSIIDSSNLTVLVDNITLTKDQRVWGNQSLVTSPINNYISTIIGNYTYNPNGSFKGVLDDIGIWNRALTQQEITNLYNSQLPTQTSLCLPTITTASPSSVGVDTVVIGGNITNDGGSSIVLRGVCYSTSPNPNMGNQRTEDGSGIGSFNTILRGLTSSTTYFARSYAKNSNGVVVYGNEVIFSTSSINIGSNYAGGIVFYVDGTGQHGLVCAPNDQGTLMWGCTGTDIAGNSTAFGTGQTNTNLILAGCSDRPIAASVCDDLVLNGYSDWYLPSLVELQLMYTNLRAQGIGGFSYATYWSSSQEQYFPSLFSLCMNFDNGYVYNTAGKNFSNQVRAVRAF